uniref:Uncharacterized protein n=1 Tax=Tetradesmus obliquus TaxID=3088 RepID=A0A383V8R7_TETOB|eukprot:jgi/Sobl393_1/3495/SZX60984.1
MTNPIQHQSIVWLVLTTLLAGFVAAAPAAPAVADLSKPAGAALRSSSDAGRASMAAVSGQASLPQQETAKRLHGTQQLLVFSTVTLLDRASANGTSPGGSSVHTPTKQQQQEQEQQRACVSVRAVLSTVQADSTEQAVMGLSSLQQHASRFRVCSNAQGNTRKQTAAAASATSPLVREVVLLIPLQETNKTAAAAAAEHTEAQSSNASANKSAHDSSRDAALPLLLMLYAEQQLDGSTYLWTASQLVMPGAASITAAINMHNFTYSWTVPQPAAPAAAAAAAAATPCKPCPASNNTSRATVSGLNEDQAAASSSAPATSATANKTTSMQRNQQQQQQQQCPPATPQAAASSGSVTSCPALLQQLPACGDWSPADAAYAVAALLHRHPDHAAWTGRTSLAFQDSSSSSSSSSNSTCPAWPVNAAMPAFLQAASRSCSSQDGASPLTPEQQSTNTSSAGLAGTPTAGAARATAAPLLAFDGSTQQLTVRASPAQLLLAAAALALLAFLAGRAIGKTASRHTSAAAAGPAGTMGNDRQVAVQQQQQQQQHKQNGAGNPRHDDRFELRDASRYDQHTAAGRKLSAAAAAAAAHSSDPFGYGDTAAAPAPAPATAADATTGARAAAVVAAVRRASVMAVSHAAGSLKDAFANRTAAAGTGQGTAFNQAAARGPAAADAAAAQSMWDEADEDTVNELPASILAHLQAGGRWARDRGGRLVRGSLNALRAASNMAAGAFASAAGGGGAAAAAGGGFAGGDGGSGSDAVLLQRLMVSGPGTELVLSDEEA